MSFQYDCMPVVIMIRDELHFIAPQNRLWLKIGVIMQLFFQEALNVDTNKVISVQKEYIVSYTFITLTKYSAQKRL